MAIIGEPQEEYEMIPLKVPIPPVYEPEPSYVPQEAPQHQEEVPA